MAQHLYRDIYTTVNSKLSKPTDSHLHHLNRTNLSVLKNLNSD